jgi:hypothetical protein
VSDETNLPDRFRDLAVSLRPYGVFEWAVPLRVVGDLAADLASDQQAILGGDFWHIREGHLDLADAPWAMRNKRMAEPWREYVDESLRFAEAALRSRSEYFSDVADPVIVSVQACVEADYLG